MSVSEYLPGISRDFVKTRVYYLRLGVNCMDMAVSYTHLTLPTSDLV